MLQCGTNEPPRIPWGGLRGIVGSLGWMAQIALEHFWQADPPGRYGTQQKAALARRGLYDL
jgi:hypothetical protein